MLCCIFYVFHPETREVALRSYPVMTEDGSESDINIIWGPIQYAGESWQDLIDRMEWPFPKDIAFKTFKDDRLGAVFVGLCKDAPKDSSFFATYALPMPLLSLGTERLQILRKAYRHAFPNDPPPPFTMHRAGEA